MGVRRPLERNGPVAARRLIRLAWALGAVAIVVVAATLLLIVRARGVQLPRGFQPPSALSALEFVGAAIVGAVLAALRPRNPVGWLLLGLGLCFVIYPLVVAYVTTALFVAPDGLPAVRWVAWIGNWIWVPGHGCIVLLFLLFPSGQLLSSRWRPVAWIGVGATVLLLIATIGYPGPFEVANSLPDANLRQRFENPLGVAGFLPAFVAALTVVQAITVVAVASLVLRLRRSRGEERQQLKWVAYAALLLGLETALLTVGHFTGLIPDQPMLWRDVLDAVTAFGLLAAIAVAVLKYRLYDIDLLINRTLVYGLLTAVLALGYAGLVLVLGQLAGQRQPNLVVAGATLATAALFQPARRRIQAAVDRRFNRRKYDAAKTIEAFSARLRDELDLNTLSAELLAVVGQTMEPRQVSLWRGHQRRRRQAVDGEPSKVDRHGPDPLHAIHALANAAAPSFAAGQGQSTTARWAPLLSLAVPCFMPQTCPRAPLGYESLERRSGVSIWFRTGPSTWVFVSAPRRTVPRSSCRVSDGLVSRP